jgi:tetratricopeptide (TPR) repeat protein
MRDRGALIQDEAGNWVEGPGLDWNLFPARVEAVVAESIGRLPQELQHLLSVASVEGETFTLEVMARVQGVEARELMAPLSLELEKRQRLVVAEGLQRVNGQRLSVYRFRHILFQRFLYNRLDLIERSHLHERVGEALEALRGEHAEEIAVRLAHHFREAGIFKKAADYLFSAGERASDSFAFTEAFAHYRSALHCLLQLPATEERDRQEASVQIAIGQTAQLLGHPAVAVAEADARGLELAEKVGTPAQLFWATNRLFIVQHYAGRWDEQLQTGRRCLALAREAGDPSLLAHGLATAAHGALFCGEFRRAASHYEELLSFYDRGKHWSRRWFCRDIGLGSLAILGEALWRLGYPIQALEKIHEGVTRARESHDPMTIQGVLAYGMIALVGGGDYDRGRAWAEEGIQNQRESGLTSLFGPYFGIYRGWCEVLQGRVEEGLPTLQDGVKLWSEWGIPHHSAWLLGAQALALKMAGRGGEGKAAFEEALAQTEMKEDPRITSDTRRLYGELLASLPEPDPVAAEAAYRDAIDIARGFEARSDELRATTGLARLLRDTGRPEEAREMLSEIYEWFTEGHELPYLVEAKDLLEELASS